jgi:hypothetical protein
MPAVTWACAILASSLAVAYGVGLRTGVLELDFDRAPPPGLQNVPPREFVYLDGARTEAYLAQLKDGNETLRTISETVAGEIGGEVGIDMAKVSAKVARSEGVERSVTPTAASKFQALVETLQEHELLDDVPDEPAAAAGSDVEVDASERAATRGPSPTAFADEWREVREGDVVSFVAMVRQPRYVQAYLALRRIAVDAPLRRRAEAALAAIGSPRLPMVIKVPKLPSATGDELRLVLAAQPEWFAAEPGLFSPRLRVVAKVVRRVRTVEYFDGELYRRFRPLLRPGLATVRARLGTSERRLRDELKRHNSLKPPAAILLPIAIYSDGRPKIMD